MHNKIARVFSALLLAVALLGAFSVTAYATETTVPSDEIWEYSVYQGHDAIITAYKGDAETIVVPDTIDGLRVIEISDSVFKDQYNLTTITLPNTLQRIGNHAFSGCVKLSSITFPEKLESVGYHAFYNCKALSKIVVKSVNLKDFDGYGNTFYDAGKESATGIAVEFAEGVTRIPANIFDGSNDNYARVKSVTVGSTVQTIGGSAFVNCFDLSSLTLAENSDMRSIGDYAFSGCVKLSSITLPEKLESVGYRAFYNCKALSKIVVKSVNLQDFDGYGNTFYDAGKESATGIAVEFAEGVAHIPANFFNGSSDNYARVTNVTIGSTIQTVGSSAFCNCADLSSVSIVANSDLRNIGDYAFSGSKKLSSITLPEKLERVGYRAFYNCKALSKIVVKSVNLKDFDGYGNTFYDAGKESATGIVVEFADGVTRIPANFFRCSSDNFARITKVSVGSNVTQVGNYAFSNCIALTEIDFSGAAPAIEKNAFNSVTATAYYLVCKDWPTSVLSNYGGDITWVQKDHPYVETVTPPSCEEEGYTTYTCACGETRKDNIVPPTGHTEVVDAAKEATCLETGLTEGKHCSVCEKVLVKQDVVPVKKHTEVVDAAKDPTCKETGLTEGKHCSVCNTVLVKQEVMPVGDHTWDNGKVTKEPTEDAEGVKTFTCTICGETKAEPIPKPDHEHSHVAKVTAPTCTGKGFTTHTCECGDSYVDTYVDPVGHKWDSGKVTKEPTEAEEGVKTFSCTVCKDTKTEPIEKLEPKPTEPAPSPVVGTWTTDLVMPASDLGVSAPDAILRATLVFSEDGKASISWEAVDLTAFKIFFHDMFVSAYCTMAYSVGITEYQQMEQYCMESTGLSISDYMDTIVTDEAMKLSFTPPSATGKYTCAQNEGMIYTDLPIMEVPSDPTVPNSFVVGNDVLYLNAASWDKPDYTFVCKK